MYIEDTKSIMSLNNPLPRLFYSCGHRDRQSYNKRFAGSRVPRYLSRTEAVHLTTEDEREIIYEHSILNLDPSLPVSKVEIKTPMDGINVKDWDLYEERIEWLVEQKMGRCAKDTSLVLLEPPIHNREWRLKAVEMFFEKFGGDSISFLKSSLMASYANSLPNSLIVDIGASSVYVAPIYEGVIMKESLLKGDFGSASLNPLLRTEITNRRADYLNISSIKTSMASKFPVLADRIKDDLIEQIKREKFKVTDTSSFRMVYNENIDNSVFELPDNKNIIIGKEAHDVPEQFFYHEKDGRPAQNPTSLQNLIYQCLENVKNYKRKDMLENIILTGGGSCIFNLSERLERELKVLLKDLSYVSKISSAHNLVERECTGWMGASVVASMSTFGEYLMDKSEYGDHGSLLIERKCLC